MKVFKACLFSLALVVGSNAIGNAKTTNIHNKNNKTVLKNDGGVNADFYGVFFEPGTADNTIYRKNSYAPYYFKNLKNNFGYNQYGSCGFIATGMLLSYLDTYYDDWMIDEKYDKVAQLPYDLMNLNVESPGIKCESESVYDVNSYQYEENVQDPEYYNEYFHLYLLKMGLDIGIRQPRNYGMYSNSHGVEGNSEALLLKHYLYAERGYSSEDVYVDYIEQEEGLRTGATPSEEHRNRVRNFVINYVKQGIPVQCAIFSYDRIGHSVIAYDYDEENDELFFHFGYSPEETHCRLSDENFFEIDWATAVVYRGTMGEISNNYVYRTNKIHNPLELVVPKNLFIKNFAGQTKLTWSINNRFSQDARFSPENMSYVIRIMDNINNTTLETLVSTTTEIYISDDLHCLNNGRFYKASIGLGFSISTELYKMYNTEINLLKEFGSANFNGGHPNTLYYEPYRYNASMRGVYTPIYDGWQTFDTYIRNENLPNDLYVYVYDSWGEPLQPVRVESINNKQIKTFDLYGGETYHVVVTKTNVTAYSGSISMYIYDYYG
ncbi:MAG: hypothetical protein J6T15_00925 [Bacilli bacterium]|nr:hypothetical protein [Bacilli bacterium]